MFPFAKHWSRRARRRFLTAAACLAGATGISFTGWTLAESSLNIASDIAAPPTRLGRLIAGMGESLARISYDRCFATRQQTVQNETCVIYLDEQSARVLDQTKGPWDRRLHTALVRRLTKERARAVFFDIVFSTPSSEQSVDAEFAQAIKENGHVFLGAALELDEGIGAFQERTVPPIPLLRKSAAGWGLLAFRPLDSDYEVRRIYTGMEMVPSATWRAAIALGAPIEDTLQSRRESRWVNYYGSSNYFPSYTFDRAVSDNGVPEGFFRDKIVFIGGRGTLSHISRVQDTFRSPFPRSISEESMPGVVVHLTVLLNLLRGEWLTRATPATELGITVLAGLLFGGLLPLVRPHLAAAVTALGIAALLGLQFYLFQWHRTWFACAIPVFAEAPLALGWAVGTRYFVEERRRTALRKAFGHYLSPAMADQISDSDFDLRPGGRLVKGTVLFTDLENFTPLSEALGNPQKLAETLNVYFTNITQHVFESQGTVIKYIGDAVLAVWGAPLDDENHATKCVKAAWLMHEASNQEVLGHRLTTRVGINSGEMLAGNLGSDYRFDYTVIGDAVNLASRLESLNKRLGTKVLISESTYRQLTVPFVTRPVGNFVLFGKLQPTQVFELLGPAELGSPAWLTTFDRGLSAYQAGDFALARRMMLETITQRGGEDGPSRFYLTLLESLETTALSGWTGVIELQSK